MNSRCVSVQKHMLYSSEATTDLLAIEACSVTSWRAASRAVRDVSRCLATCERHLYRRCVTACVTVCVQPARPPVRTRCPEVA